MNTALIAFGLPGGSEWIIIGIIVLLVFGPKNIPKLARSFGKAKREFKDAQSAFTDAMEDEANKPAPKNIAPPVEGEELKSEAKTAAKSEETK